MNNRNGLFLKTLRENSKLTQLEVSDSLHVKRQTVSNWELSKTVVDLEFLDCLANLYNFDLEKLIRVYIREENEPSPEETIHIQIMNKAAKERELAAKMQIEQKEIAVAGEVLEPADAAEDVKAECAVNSVAMKTPKKDKSVKKKMHPLLKTALLSAGISAAVCVCIVICLAIFVSINEHNYIKVGYSSKQVYYAFDFYRIALYPIVFIVVTTVIATAIHYTIRLIKKRRI